MNNAGHIDPKRPWPVGSQIRFANGTAPILAAVDRKSKTMTLTFRLKPPQTHTFADWNANMAAKVEEVVFPIAASRRGGKP